LRVFLVSAAAENESLTRLAAATDGQGDGVMQEVIEAGSWPAKV